MDASARARSQAQELLARLRSGFRTLVQAALSVGLAWIITTELFGYEDPFFAPIAAVIVLNSLAQRGRRAVEVVIGVATGIAVADVFIWSVGTGWWQLVLVTVLAMALVIALGGSPLVLTQAGVSAILVATIQPPHIDWVPHRFFHAVIGGICALLIAQVILPLDPLQHLRRSMQPLIDDLVTALEEIAEALRTNDVPAARKALHDARALDRRVAEFRETIGVAQETAKYAPAKRRRRHKVRVYDDALQQIDLAIRNTRVLARAALEVVETGTRGSEPLPAPPEVCDAVHDLAVAVRALGQQLADDASPDDTRIHAGRAAARTRVLFADAHDLAINRVVGQIRSTGIDLLRCSGLEVEEAQKTLYEAAGPEDQVRPDPARPRSK